MGSQAIAPVTQIRKCSYCGECKEAEKHNRRYVCFACRDRAAQRKANARSDDWWSGAEGKRHRRRVRAERDGRVKVGRFWHTPDFLERREQTKRQTFERNTALKAEQERAKAEREAARRAMIAACPWLDRSLPQAERFSLRYRLDPDFNLKERMRAAFKRKRQGKKLGDLLRDAVKRNGNSPKAEAFVGYSVAALRQHIERQFTAGMTWRAFCDGRIHIDHIRPLASFNLSDPRELKAAWNLANLRPAWAVENLTKSSK